MRADTKSNVIVQYQNYHDLQKNNYLQGLVDAFAFKPFSKKRNYDENEIETLTFENKRYTNKYRTSEVQITMSTKRYSVNGNTILFQMKCIFKLYRCVQK